MDNIILKDEIGVTRSIPVSNVMQYFCAGGVIIYGLTAADILQFRAEYLKLGGEFPITPSSIKAIMKQRDTTYNQDKNP